MAKPRTTVERGYGQQHKDERTRYERLLMQGAQYRCACERDDCPLHEGRCRVVITKDTPRIDWDLGHSPDRTTWVGPECVPCNRSAGARNSRASALDPMTVREWPTPA